MKLLLAIKTIVFIVCMCVLMPSPIAAVPSSSSLTKEDKLFYANTGGIVFLTTWGIVNWDYGDNSPRSKSEGWFSQNTKEGGADKLGHFYSSYLVSHGFSYLCTVWGFSREQASKYGSYSSFALMSFMEIGDAFSNYGFSYEDFVMNLFGCYTGYLLYKYPEISKRIDLRIEYIPDFSQSDIITDYGNMKFLLAFKLNGFHSVQNKYLKLLEFHLGYYARGYGDKDIENKRYAYLGIGINISRLFSKIDCYKTSKIFNYYQAPYTYMPLERNLQN